MASNPKPASRSVRAAEAAPLVTIVIVNYNGAHLLPPCLSAVESQTFPQEHLRTIVVDNGSRDGSVDLVKERFPWAEVLSSPENRGFAGGNNLALRRVGTPFVALLNNDAVPEPDWLERLLAAATAPGADRVGAVTSKIVFLPKFIAIRLETDAFRPPAPDTRELGIRVYDVEIEGESIAAEALWDSAGYGSERDADGAFRWTRARGELLIPIDRPGPLSVRLRIAAERAKRVRFAWEGGEAEAGVTPTQADVDLQLAASVPRVDVLNNAGSRVNRDGYGGDRAFRAADRSQFDRREEVFALCGAAVLLRTEALRRVGTFDDDFFLYYEDTDLSWRLRAAGWSIVYEPTAVVRHAHSATSVEWSPVFTFHVERNRLLMLTKNARAGLAAGALREYAVSTVREAVRVVRPSAAERRRAALRLRVLGSYLRLLPSALRKRRAIARSASVARRDLERWLEP